jgi:predicted ATP-grasp superfamily ATP-dependent carboligase
MNLTVLLLSTATRWLGTARMPRALAVAGFEVALIAPRGSLALHSRFVSQAALLSETALAIEVLHTLIRMVDRVSPRMLLPCDEMAVRLLFELALDPPSGLPADVAKRLSELIAFSLGDRRHYAVSIDKTLLPSAAEEIGVSMPPCIVAGSVDEGAAFAEAQGYPVVVKRRFGFAGGGLAVVRSRPELDDAMRRLMRPDQLDLGAQEASGVLVQAFVTGPHISQAVVSLDGETLAGFAWERFAATSPVAGQSTVLRAVGSPETRESAERLCRALSISGFSNMQFVVDASTKTAHLLEINRRIVTHTHVGQRFGADLAQALYDRLAGRSPGSTSIDLAGAAIPLVVFPREWLNDPASPLLREYPVDVPWDDPALFAALLRMRHEVETA